MLGKNQKSVYKSLVDLFFKYPVSFFKQLNKENWNTLKRALLNEPSSQIISNAQKLLKKTNKDNVEGVSKSIRTFVDSIQNPENRKICLFVSHESTVTGAPLIILNIARNYSDHLGYLPIQILCVAGELEEEFKKVGATYVLEFYHNRVLLGQEIKMLTEAIKERFDIELTLVNSEGSTRLLPYLKRNGITPLISLIHEMGNYYPKNSWSHVNNNSDKIIFPAQYVKEKALENTNFDEDKLHVLGQGLLKPQLLLNNTDRDYRLEIRKELGIPKESRIILGCGSLIPRKGIDLFIFTAISTLNRIDKLVPVYFIWIGEADFNDHQIWANRDIQYSGHSDRIRFIGVKKDTIPYFKGSDIFLLTSRGDPFPCVVHEALAAGMPVIGFKNAGGVPEMIDHKRGYLSNYADIYSTSNKILNYIDNPELLKEHSSNAHNFAQNQLDFGSYVKKLNTIVKN